MNLKNTETSKRSLPASLAFQASQYGGCLHISAVDDSHMLFLLVPLYQI